MTKRVLAIALVATLAGIATSQVRADNETAGRIRDALSGALGATICSGAASAWCAALGVNAAYWIDKKISLAIDRHFEAKDQAFANKHNITICYSNGHCIRPHK